jgi:hypothetical protein
LGFTNWPVILLHQQTSQHAFWHHHHRAISVDGEERDIGCAFRADDADNISNGCTSVWVFAFSRRCWDRGIRIAVNEDL